MANNARKSRLILFGLGVVIIVGAAILYASSDQFRSQASTLGGSLGFSNSSGLCEMKKVGNTANARIFIQNAVGFDASVNLSSQWHPTVYQVQSDESLIAISQQLCLGIIKAPESMRNAFRFYNLMAYNGAIRMNVKAGERYQIKFDGQPYCPTTEFEIPDDFTTAKKNQVRDIVVAPETMKTVAGLRPGEQAPKIGSDALYIPIDYLRCNHYEPDQEAKEYTGVLQLTPTKQGVVAAYPFTFSMDDESYSGGGGNYLVSTLVGDTTEHNLTLERQLRSIADAHPTVCPQVGCGPTYYITLKGKLGPEIHVGNTSGSQTQRYLHLESIAATDVKDYTEMHSGTLIADPNPSRVLGTKYRLIDNEYPQPFQPLHFIIPKSTEVDNELKAMVGKQVTVFGRRSSHGLRYLDATNATTAMEATSR